MRFSFACLALILSVTTAQAAVFNPETVTLKNGLQVIVLPNHRAPVVTQMLWIKAGAKDDPWGKSGIAHFLEHLSFKGTEKYPKGSYSSIISHLGGEQNAFTTNDYTAYYATVGKEHLEKIIDLESDRFSHLTINDADIKTERDVILQERQQRTENDPVSAFFEEVNALLYPNHPYQRPTIGWRSEMEILDRNDAQSFHDAYYTPDNAILIFSGAVKLAEILPLVEKYYGSIPSHALAARPNPAVPPVTANKRITENSPLVKEMIWSAHLLVPPARPKTINDSDTLRVWAKILGDGRTGRLYKQLVVNEKLATSASASYDAQSLGPARFTIIVTPKPGVDLKLIERAVRHAISPGDITQDDHLNAVNALQIDAIYARDSIMGPAMIIGEGLASGLDLATIENWPRRLENITLKSVIAEGRKIKALYQNAIVAIIKPEAAQ